MMEDDPFHTTESDFDPIMIAARLAHERRASTMTSSPPPQQQRPYLLEQHRQLPIMTPSFSTTTAAQQERKPVWRHSRTISTDLAPFLPTRPTEPITLMVLGKTGDGKSSLLNDVLGHEVFKQKASVKSQTQQVVEKEGFWAPLHPYLHGKQTFGCMVHVYDTPGFGDSLLRDDQFLVMIKQCIQATRIHCFLLVFKVTTRSQHKSSVPKQQGGIKNPGVGGYQGTDWANAIVNEGTDIMRIPGGDYMNKYGNVGPILLYILLKKNKTKNKTAKAMME
ncbi:hypothetical protein BC941DRAFT_456925 [Chlamydoabsidia padenii]|nr:hypothetical protein BC941DRAFT_456925 [Chlamydoabsidia padenii]